MTMISMACFFQNTPFRPVVMVMLKYRRKCLNFISYKKLPRHFCRDELNGEWSGKSNRIRRCSSCNSSSSTGFSFYWKYKGQKNHHHTTQRFFFTTHKPSQPHAATAPQSWQPISVAANCQLLPKLLSWDITAGVFSENTQAVYV